MLKIIWVLHIAFLSKGALRSSKQLLWGSSFSLEQQHLLRAEPKRGDLSFERLQSNLTGQSMTTIRNNSERLNPRILCPNSSTHRSSLSILTHNVFPFVHTRLRNVSIRVCHLSWPFPSPSWPCFLYDFPIGFHPRHLFPEKIRLKKTGWDSYSSRVVGTHTQAESR